MEVNLLRHLHLDSPFRAGLLPHVAAASGLVRAGQWLHVVPDDDLSLASFALDGSGQGRAHRLFPDPDLPLDHVERKALKPDLESLTLLDYGPGQALMALGSGSTERRERGVLQPLFDWGEVDGAPIVFDLSPLYAALPYDSLNIEGLAVVGQRLFLGQRGNSASGSNGLVELNLAAALKAIEEKRPWTADLVIDTRPVGLGEVMGVRLTLTDLSPYGPDHLLICAAAEDTDNPYDDGVIMGSVLGRYSLEDHSMVMVSLDGPWKVEGVEALEDGRILMVTDGDDPHKPAHLLEVRGLTFDP